MDFKDACLAYLANELDEQQRVEFEKQLAASEEKQTVFQQYQQLLALEAKLAEETAPLGAHFTVKVMDALEEQQLPSAGFLERYQMLTRKFFIPIATVAVAVLCISLVVRKGGDDMTGLEVLTKEASTAQSRLEANSVQSAAKPSAGSTQQKNVEEAAEQQWFDAEESKDVSPKMKSTKPLSLDVSPPSLGTADDSVDALERFGEMDAGAPLVQDLQGPAAVNQRHGGGQSSKGTAMDMASAGRALSTESHGLGKEQQSSAQLHADKLMPQRREKSELQRQDVRKRANEEQAASRRLQEEYAGRSPKQQPIVVPAPGRGVVPPRPIPAVQGERYGEYQENLRTAVQLEPRSTFSFDVDTGSYANVRRFLKMGQLPPAAAVRPEELVNYFDYRYPSQTEKPFSVHYEIAPSPFSAGRHLLKIGVLARDVVEAESRVPWNLVFLIDVSGSMASANKLPLLKRALSVLIDQMRPEDRISIVTYSGGAELQLPPTSGSQKDYIRSIVSGLRAAGSTNGSAGIELAYQTAAAHASSYQVNRVVLATDGDFNVGISDVGVLLRRIADRRRSGIMLTTIGLGEGDLNEEMLERLADNGNGSYHYLDSFQEARRVLSDKLTAAMQTVAKDVKLQIEFNPQQVLEYRLIGYDNRVLQNRDFSNDAVDAGEVGSGQSVTAFYELVLAGSPAAEQLQPTFRYQQNAPQQQPVPEGFSDELAFVKIRFKQPDAQTSAKMQFPVTRANLHELFGAASEDFRFAASVAAFADLLRGGQYAEGAYSYQDVIAAAQGAVTADPQGHRREFLDLVRNAQAVRR